MSATVLRPTRTADLFEWLSNVELQIVLDGGSARVVAVDALGVEYAAYIDLDGLWIAAPDGPGYAMPLRGWAVERCY